MNSILRRVTFKAFPKKYNGYMSFATSEAEKTVLVDNSNGKLTLKLNRPKALNSLTLEMVDQLYSELKVRFYWMIRFNSMNFPANQRQQIEFQVGDVVDEQRKGVLRRWRRSR